MSLKVAFPNSVNFQWLVGIAIAEIIAKYLLRLPNRQHTLVNGSLLFGVIVGTFQIVSQIPDQPSTRPLNFDRRLVESNVPINGDDQRIELADNVKLVSYDGHVEVNHRFVSLSCWPLLDFEHKTEDGAWSILGRREPRPRFQQGYKTPNNHQLFFNDGSLLFATAASGNITSIDAYSNLVQLPHVPSAI